MGKVDCEISKTIVWRSIPWDDAVFDKPIGSSVNIDSGQPVKNCRPNESLFREGYPVGDILELRGVVVEVADPDNHWNCLPLLRPKHSTGDLGKTVLMQRATKRAFKASRSGQVSSTF